MIVLYYQHDVPADSLLLRLFHGAELIATITMVAVEGDRESFWRGEIEAPVVSSAFYGAYENGGEQRVGWGQITGLIDGATVDLSWEPVPLDAAGMRAALGISVPNVDEQFTAITEQIANLTIEVDPADFVEPIQAAIAEAIGAGIPVASFLPAALAQLGGKSIIVSLPTLSGSQLSAPLVRGDSYLASQGRSIDFSRSDFPDIPDGSQVRLTAAMEKSPATKFTITGSIPVATGQKVVRFEPTTLQSREWIPGKYRFDVDVVFPDGNVATFVGPNVSLHVLEDVTVPG